MSQATIEEELPAAAGPPQPNRLAAPSSDVKQEDADQADIEAKAKAALAAAVERRRQEDRVLASAKEIQAFRSMVRSAPAGERPRQKTHWDHVLNEMQWLAKEFQKERRWKLLTARKVANAAQRSNLDLESRVEVRAREEEKAIRRRAAWIAREVSAFWTKAQRVVAFKVRSEVEAKKKQVLDRQLEVLLGQTQKYSSFLAQRLAADERVEAIAAASKAAEEPASTAADQAGPSGTHSPRKPQGEGFQPSSAAVSANVFEREDSKEYRSGEDDDADDEGTLEEEEAIARAEGRNLAKDEAEEARALEEDADLPLEVLLARYGYVVPKEEEEIAAYAANNASAGPSAVHRAAVAAADEGSDAESENLAVLLEEPAPGPGEAVVIPPPAPPPSRLATEFAELSDQEGAGSVDEESAGPAASGGVSGRQGDEDEYRSGEDDDADDEGTLEEEEAMARAEGRNLAKDEAEEAAALAEDAELPLEELMARYGYVIPTDDAGEVKEEEMEDAKPSTENGSAPDPSGAVGNQTDAEIFAGTMEAMAAAQPTGHTLETAKVKTPVPFLLKGQLREYQHVGLDWLVTLYHRRLNGILADEMGLGKTIQTIALLAWLACERGDWGPHLVVVPTSVMLNWEMEFKRWCPAFKLLTYYGSPKERAAKRQGWSKPNAFHVCITSYTLVLQDARVFRRKKWKYLILDEAHMIKNWRSQRWQTLLNFNSKRRLLITGTPLQNDLMELWSLMHFLMPQVFASHAQFKDWFSNPLTGMVEGSAEYNRAIVERLHAVLRPFLLRRLKRDVEKQLPGKHEHVLRCRLSKRQRQLYEEYMASRETRNMLSSGSYIGIMNCLMQLRKVCNHPDLFEGRPIISAFDMPQLELRVPSAAVDSLERRGGGEAAIAAPPDLDALGLVVCPPGRGMEGWEAEEVGSLALPQSAFAQPATAPQEDVAMLFGGATQSLLGALGRAPSQDSLAAVGAAVQALVTTRRLWRQGRTAALGRVSTTRCMLTPPVTAALSRAAHVECAAADVHLVAAQRGRHLDYSNALLDVVKLPERRADEMDDVLRSFVFVIPKARAKSPMLWCSHPDSSAVAKAADRARVLWTAEGACSQLLHVPRLRTQLFFPDRRLIQYDCGKLQELAVLLRRLKSGGHRALIFTQMSKMLDVLEAFLTLNGHTYVRLDGATKPEMRQILMQRFNTDERIFCFILSTRSGGVGMNLTGADTVIFYDSDWNPAMDAQAQDRCHRIGQTREVHIYRLVSEHTIEENILRKSDQKRQLDFLAIQSGGFTTEILQQFDPTTLLTDGLIGAKDQDRPSAEAIRAAMRAAEDEGDAAAAAAVEQEAAAEMDEFTKEPPPGAASEADANGDGADEGGDAGPSEAAPSEGNGVEAAPEAAAPGAGLGGDDDEAMAEVVRMAGGGPGGDAMAHLEGVLRPIERYAVRFVELEAPVLDKQALEAQMEATFKVDEFDVDAIEAAEEEREADIDDDEEANVVADWNLNTATTAYAAQVQQAEEEERQRAEAEAAWLAQYGLMAPLEPPSHAGGSGGGARGRPRGGRVSSGAVPGGLHVEEADTALSPGATWGLADEGVAAKRRKTSGSLAGAWGGAPLPAPWEPAEDFVLASVVALLLQAGTLPGPNLWTAASDALAAGAASTSVTGMQTAARQVGRRRTPEACGQRYAQLRAGYIAAYEGQNGEAMAAVAALKAHLLSIVAAASLPGPARAALTVTHAALSRAAQQNGSGLGASVLQAFEALRMEVAHGTELAPVTLAAAPGAAVAGPLPQAQAIAACVRQGCGSGAARVISGRLPAVVQAACAGGSLAAGEVLLDAVVRPAEAMARSSSIGSPNGQYLGTGLGMEPGLDGPGPQ